MIISVGPNACFYIFKNSFVQISQVMQIVQNRSIVYLTLIAAALLHGCAKIRSSGLVACVFLNNHNELNKWKPTFSWIAMPLEGQWLNL